MLKFLKTILASLILFFSFSTVNNAYAAVDKSDPNQVVKAAVDNTFTILKKYSGKISSQNAQLRAEVESEVLPYFNTNIISALALGPFYKAASADRAKYTEFTKAVANYMTNAYIEGLGFYKGQRVMINPAKLLGDKLAEATVVVYDSKPINVTFKLYKVNNEYSITDFTAEGISIAATKALEWKPIIASQGLDRLTQYVNESSKNILGRYKSAVEGK